MILSFGNVLVAIHKWGTVIAWPDGTHVIGMPEDNDVYRKTAHEHGYGDDTLSLCREHELLHVALCHWLGTPSPVMEACRLGGDMPGADIRRLEEAAVLAIQRFAKAMDVDLIHALTAWQR
jgi:hypothetical protein